MVKEIIGKCPYTHKTQSILVDYIYVPMTGTLQNNYKKVKYDCHLSDECSIDVCPLYNDAPKSITE